MLLPRDINEWPENWYFLWSERAAIIEFMANRTRSEAERTAEQAIRKMAAEAWESLT